WTPSSSSWTASASVEAPRWHEGRLWYSDFFRRAIYTVSASGDRKAMFADLD
ncbi:MAG: hypothetical protein AVDCRST_MAG50-435, partial [uncultured Acidimicrobiales bacterium]